MLFYMSQILIFFYDSISYHSKFSTRNITLQLPMESKNTKTTVDVPMLRHECAFEVDFSIIPPYWTLFSTTDWSRSTDTIFFQAVTSVAGVMY